MLRDFPYRLWSRFFFGMSGMPAFRMRMNTVVNTGFKRMVVSVAMMATACAMAPSLSFAEAKKDCPAAGCGEMAASGDEAADKDRRLAQQGDAAGQLALGLRYLMGNKTPADEHEAQEWLLKSAQQDNVAAQVTLAAMLAFESDKQDLSSAAVWFEKAAAAGNVQAMSELVRLYETGSGVARDMAKADEWRTRAKAQSGLVRLGRAWKVALADRARWTVSPSETVVGEKAAGAGNVPDMAALERAAENGDDHAQTVLGALLATGDGVARNDAAALDWFGKAADAGNAQAQAVLGELYASGWGGLKKDEAAAAKWMERAALGNLVSAEAEWGSMLMEGKGVKKDPAKGLSWIAKAAQDGDGRARLMMATMLLGQGDRDSAAKWFYGAADVGDEEALSALGAFYGWGNGPVLGESEKLTEVRRYAQRDESEAQVMMGFLYGEGWGTKRDAAKAEYWFGKAVSGGDVEAWLPLGLLYAETGREDRAAAAFAKAVALGGFSLANDGELLQMIFVESEKAPGPGHAMTRSPAEKKTVAPDGSDTGNKAAAGEKDVYGPAKRHARVARKRAFLESEVQKGNPAAQLMMATILKQGWGVKKDGAAAASLRAAGIEGMCAALKEKAEEESLCSRETTDGNDDGKAAVPPGKAGRSESDVFRVTEGAS